jgi:CHAT domain-containing protein
VPSSETGKGEVLRSEGIQSTARSFLIAGAESVIATQWQVKDDVASVLATTFYRYLFGGRSPTEALRAAKLFLIEGGSSSSFAHAATSGVSF